MREYGQVQSAFWQSRDAQNFSDTGKLLALYLLTGPHSNGIGCFRLPDGYVTGDLGWSNETVSAGFAELSRNGFAYRFDGVVFIPNFLRWNRIANNNVAHARLTEFEALPKGEARTRLARAMLEFCACWRPEDRAVIETVSETVSETVCQPEPNPTQPRENPKAEEREKPHKPKTETPNDTSPTNPVTDLPASQPRRRPQVELDTWLDSLPADEPAVKPDDPVFGYARDAGIPANFIELAWFRFSEEMRIGHKRQRDWRAHFRNSIRGQWYKLWWFDLADGGRCKLTTKGEQARRAFEAERRDAA